MKGADASPWSIRFDRSRFTDFLFATGDKKAWMKVAKSELLPKADYTDKSINLISSSTRQGVPNRLSVKMSNQAAVPSDPTARLTDPCDYDGCVLYLEGGIKTS